MTMTAADSPESARAQPAIPDRRRPIDAAGRQLRRRRRRHGIRAARIPFSAARPATGRRGNRFTLSLEHPDDHDADNTPLGSVEGQAVGTLGARLLDGRVTSIAVIVDDKPTISTVQHPHRRARSLTAASGPRTVHLPDRGEYRIIVTAGQRR